MTTLAEAAATLLGVAVAREEPLSGGDLSQLLRVTFDDGRRVIVKKGPDPVLEGAMLERIAAASVPAPHVYASSPAVLVIEEITTGGRSSGAGQSLGSALRRLHETTGGRYGWDKDFAFGSVVIENGLLDDWPDFWATRRLRVHAQHVSHDLCARIERLAADLQNRLPRHPPASLLHGDLWSGNILVSNGELAALIDPACYFGHGEVDIAMLSLFGSHGTDFFDAYGPLEPGSNERLAIYQLWPALVHLRLFGSGYRGMVEGLLARLGI